MIRMLLNRLLCLLVVVLPLLAGAQAARAEVVIDITNANVQPLPIAIPRFAGSSGSAAQTGQDIARVISADLERSGLFRPLDPASFIQTPDSLQAGPRFADWRMINAQALVSGKVDVQPDGRLRIEFRLWDVGGEAQMVGQVFTAPQSSWRRLSHKIADAIYQRITGEEGYFDTQIIYVAENGPWNKRIRRLALMDQDGENHAYLTDGSDMVLTPRFSPTQREITYMSYYRDTPRVYLYNLDTGRREVLGDFPDMTFAPRFSPDGNKVIMSLMKNGNSSIHVMDLRTRRSVQLTDGPVIDTSPSYAPDGSQIVFNSDRAGTQQLYVMAADGSGQRRISFGDGRYATPVWSPRGDLIAFTKMKGGEFFIGVMRPDGSGERLLARGFLVEGPTWAPNGRVIAYWKQSPSDSSGRNTSQLYSIDLTGNNERPLLTPLNGSDPAWSPLIP